MSAILYIGLKGKRYVRHVTQSPYGIVRHFRSLSATMNIPQAHAEKDITCGQKSGRMAISSTHARWRKR